MNNLNIGFILNSEQHRDAVHMALAPLIAGERLSPGQHVGINESGRASALAASIGVVDPFLKVSVASGERFWLFLYPGTVTGLRHEWSHPSFQDSVPITRAVSSESEKWLREFAESVDADYDEMMDVATSRCGDSSAWNERYLIQGGKWEGQGTPDEFWTHFTNVTGKKPNTPYGLPGIFSCSC